MADFLNPFQRSPEDLRRDRSIMETVQPSAFIPKAGDYFRVRFATIADRSYIDVIWKCLAFQDGAALGKHITGTCFSKEPHLFVVGDVIFYEANDIGKALEESLPPAHKGDV